MTGNFNSLEKRLDKIEDLLEKEWSKEIDVTNLFDKPCFSNEERQCWQAFLQHIGGSDLGSQGSKGINLSSWSDDDLKILKAWATLYKERTADSA